MKTSTRLADGRELPVGRDRQPPPARTHLPTLAGCPLCPSVPHVARWAFEVGLHPRRHVPDLTRLDEAARAEFPALYLDVLQRFDGIFGTRMPYIAGWQQAPVRYGREQGHLFMQVFSIRRAPNKLKCLGGSEAAMKVFINDIAPERAAKMLREAR